MMEQLNLEQLNSACYEKNILRARLLCKQLDLNALLSFLPLSPSSVEEMEDDVEINELIEEENGDVGEDVGRITTLKLLCNWTDSLKDDWEKMVPPPHLKKKKEGGGGRQWVLLDSDDANEPDYWIIINAPPPNASWVPSRTIVFQMEPHMDAGRWGEWANPTGMLRVFSHATDYNNIEWHLGLSQQELLTRSIVKEKDDVVSVILSSKNADPGHVLRNAFVEYLLSDRVEDHEVEVKLHVFGNNIYNNTNIHLPPNRKEVGLFPYKYHFAAENNSIFNYFTEKIVDAILSECLCFYWGCPNIATHIDPRAYIYLDIRKPKESMELMMRAIQNNEWEKRIDVIREVKRKLLTEMNMFSRIESILN
jgi:hypothetical protein